MSASVEVSDGAALRVLTCREVGPRDQEPKAWYELGIDGRQALIRRMSVSAPPKVLARIEKPVPNGKVVRLSGQCVPDADGGLVLALQLDGKRVAQARDAKPLPAVQDGVEASPAIRAYARPDTPNPATSRGPTSRSVPRRSRKPSHPPPVRRANAPAAALRTFPDIHLTGASCGSWIPYSHAMDSIR